MDYVSFPPIAEMGRKVSKKQSTCVGVSLMTPKRWMFVAWFAILSVVIGVCALYGGRQCEVQKSGPFHGLLAGRRYFQTTNHWRSGGCSEVRSDGTALPLPINNAN